MKFKPEEILFSHIDDCNLSCAHCNVKKTGQLLSKRAAVKFLKNCKKNSVTRVGFTGGEPFMEPDFLCAVIKQAVKEGMLFDKIITNGVWFGNKRHLKKVLTKLQKAGYDGSICVSVDVLHRQSLKKLALFIKLATAMWRRSDFISIAYTKCFKDHFTALKLRKLAKTLNAKLHKTNGCFLYMKNEELFIRFIGVRLSPVGRARGLKNEWGNEWFKEDHCRGPGNVFFVLPSGDVKPCCGYAHELKEFTIGNINRDSVETLMNNLKRNRFISTVFTSGLSAIRKRLQKKRIIFPGKAGEHCYFCHYVLTSIPKETLVKCLN